MRSRSWRRGYDSAVVAVLGIHVACSVARARRWRDWLVRRQPEASRSAPKGRLLFLLPVHQNPSAVADAGRWFARLQRGCGRADVDFVLISTEREGRDSETFRACQQAVARNGLGWHHLHSEARPYGKASQLNDAVNRFPGASHDWVVVYDIDGRPEVLPDPDACPTGAVLQQQVTVPGLAGTSSNWLTRGHAAGHLRRVLNAEVGRWAGAQRKDPRGLTGRPSLTPASYAWGNGLCIRRDALAALGGFPFPADDLELGYAATAERMPCWLRPELVWHSQHSSAADIRRSVRGILDGLRPVRARRWARADLTGRLQLALAEVAALDDVLRPLLLGAVVAVGPGKTAELRLAATLAYLAVPAAALAPDLGRLSRSAAEHGLPVTVPSRSEAFVAAPVVAGIRFAAAVQTRLFGGTRHERSDRRAGGGDLPGRGSAPASA